MSSTQIKMTLGLPFAAGAAAAAQAADAVKPAHAAEAAPISLILF